MPINNNHDYDSLSLEVAYAGNMPKNMSHICDICSIYAAHMRRIFRQILHIFLHILPQKVPHILKKFSAINRHPYLNSKHRMHFSYKLKGPLPQKLYCCYLQLTMGQRCTFHKQFPNTISVHYVHTSTSRLYYISEVKSTDAKMYRLHSTG